MTQTKENEDKTPLGITLIGGPILEKKGNHYASTLMHISFYIPEHHLPSKELQAGWLGGYIPSLLEGGKSACAQCWIYQTWVLLRKECDVELVTEMPKEGAIVTLSNFLGNGFRVAPGQFIAAIAADYIPHPGAQLQILQNKAHAERLPGSRFMPLWPQPNLIPRDLMRGDRLERVAFLGDPANLAPELADPEFSKHLKHETGADFEVRGAPKWHDFSDVDVILAIRDFTSARQLHKPATKLYNAWLAGVPLIGGSDSAFAAEGSKNRDYLVARSLDDCITLVAKLARDFTFRQRLVESGQKKAASRSRDAVRQNWMDFCNIELPEHFHRWMRKGTLARKQFWIAQNSMLFLDRNFRS